MCTAPARCCSPRLQDGRCCLERPLLTWIERFDVCVVFVSWLQLEFVPLRVLLGALGSLRLLSIVTIHSVFPRCFGFLARAFHPHNSFCFLSAPLSMVTALCPVQSFHACEKEIIR
jgi:hypothetical protein